METIPYCNHSLGWKLKESYCSEEKTSNTFSGVGGVKLLGAPLLQHKTDMLLSPKIAKTVSDLLESWKCRENMKTMIFDITASNVRAITAACVSIQNSLNKELL